MRRSLLALGSLSLLSGLIAACSASGSAAPDDTSGPGPMATVDAGRTGKPVPGKTTGDDDDTTEPDIEDAGSTKDAGKDASKPDASLPPPDAGPCSFTGILAKYDLNALSGSAAKADVTTQNGGIVATSIVRVGVTASSASGALNATGWPTSAALDATKYFSLTLTAPAACAFTTSSVVLQLDASGTGPKNGSLAASADAYANARAVSTADAVVTVPLVVDTAAGSTLEVRIYGYGGSSTTGTMRLDKALTISGSLH